MPKMTINDLKLEIAEIIEEAKKKKEKAEKNTRFGKHMSAYGYYDESHDFSAPLGAHNLYRQQGAVNWGPFTSEGPKIDSGFQDPQATKTTIPQNTELTESEERAIRSVVREVVRYGLVPRDSAWGALVQERRDVAPKSNNPWEIAEAKLSRKK